MENVNLTDDQKVFRNRELPIRQRMEAWINHVATFYTRSTRAVEDNGACVYHATANSPGCAIGKELDGPVPSHLTDLRVTSLYEVEGLLPAWMKDFNVYFLLRLQDLHDDAFNWQADGLSETGLIQQNQLLGNIREGGYDPGRLTR